MMNDFGEVDRRLRTRFGPAFWVRIKLHDTKDKSMAETSSTGTKKSGGLEANFSTLALSIASSAAMALGLAPNPANGKVEKDLELARFNIDLLRMLREKTKGNLADDEQKFIESIISDLQMKFVTAK